MASTLETRKENGDKLELTQVQLNDLVEATGQSEQEVRKIFEEMQGKFPSGGLTEEEFLSLFSESPTDFDEGMFVLPKDVFTITDRDHSGKITLYEYILTVALFGKNDTETVMNCLFKLCDTDDNGYLSQTEVVDIWTTLLRAMNKDAKESEIKQMEQNLAEVKNEVREAFGDKAQVSQQEFRQFSTEKDAIKGLIESLQIFVVMSLSYLGAAFE